MHNTSTVYFKVDTKTGEEIPDQDSHPTRFVRLPDVKTWGAGRITSSVDFDFELSESVNIKRVKFESVNIN